MGIIDNIKGWIVRRFDWMDNELAATITYSSGHPHCGVGVVTAAVDRCRVHSVHLHIDDDRRADRAGRVGGRGAGSELLRIVGGGIRDIDRKRI